MSDVDPLGGVVGTEEELAMIRVDCGLEVVQMSQGCKMVRGQAESEGLIIAELGVRENSLQ